MNSASRNRALYIGIELTAYRKKSTGVEVYIRNLVRHVVSSPSPHRFVLFVNLQDWRIFRKKLPKKVRIIPIALRWRPTRTIGHQVIVPILARFLRLDVLHSTAFVVSFFCRSARQVLTVYDMTFFTLPDPVRPPTDAAFRKAVLASLSRADMILVPSHTTQDNIRRVLPDLDNSKIRIIRLGVGSEYHPRPPAEVAAVRNRLGLPDNYILFVGTLEPRKNLVRLLHAFRTLATTEQCSEHLVLAGQMGWDSAPLQEAIDIPELAGRVHVTGYVAQEDLPALYAGARLFVYPSLEEGFGLPPLEAMASGTPVISSIISSTSEMLAGAACLVDPTNESQLTAAMASILKDAALHERLAADGLRHAVDFSWETLAAKTIAAYEECAALPFPSTRVER